MSERKVLNKYYPPDFDPSKIPRMKLPKNRQYTVRLMAPFNMRCKTCGEYIYKGKKFNARKEDVENEDYLGIRIYRFYIKCTRCLQEISFKTDPRNTDYEIEAGATRNFMALKLAEEQAQREEEEEKEEEANNPMKLLENRTKQSKNEIELLESLEELKDLNRRQRSVDFDSMLLAYDTQLTAREREERLQQLDEDYIKTIKFESNQKRKVVVEEEIVELDDGEPEAKQSKADHEVSSDINFATDEQESTQSKPKMEAKAKELSTKTSISSQSWNKSIGGLSRKIGLSGLVKINKSKAGSSDSTVTSNDPECVLLKPSNSEEKELKTKSSPSSSQSWNKSLGGLSTSKMGLSSLVKVNKIGTNKIAGSESSTSISIATSKAVEKGSTGLSLLGGYSGSDSSDAD